MNLVSTPDALSGGGEMGALIRSIDWSAHALGPVDQWPQSLKTAVSICLSSRFPILIWWGQDFLKLYNDAYRPMLGAKHPQAMGQPGREAWSEIWHIIGPMLDGVMRDGVATWSDDQMLPLHRNGYTEECYFTYSYSPIRDETGGIGGVFCAVTETTERVLSERRLATLRTLAERTASESSSPTEACRAAAATLGTNPEDVPFALFYLLDDAGERLTLVSAAGLSPDDDHIREIALGGEATRRDGWALDTVMKERSTALVTDVGARFGSLVNKPWPEPVENAVILPIARAGQERPYGMLVAGVSPRRILDDAYRGFFALVASHVATAVGNARAYEEERERATALAELDRAKTAFFSNVSHEFRTPLTLLLGPLEECLSGADALSSSMRESLGVSHRNALRLLKLVNSLLEFSRIEAGRVQAVYEATDLAGYTSELASSFRSAVERAGIAFVVDCPPLTEPVFIDRDMWEKIVLNLLSNAFKFTFAGQITVTLRSRDGYAELVVRDTGTGIPAAEISKVFERFHRVANVRSRTYEGTGIGLALVKELVKCHGGQIDAESTEGAGSAFIVRLPLGSAHLPADRVRGASMSSWTAASRLGIASYIEEARSWSLPSEADGESFVPVVDDDREQISEQARVLLADDNADMREYVARLLRAQGWAVHTVSDGRAALDAAIATKPDLVLSDVMMPSLDGFGLLRELRAREDTKSIPILLLSARAGVEARVDGAHAGADDYIVKPFVAQELVARVGSQLALARERARAVAAFERALDELQRIFQQSPSIIAVLRGADHRFALANDSYLQLVGRAAEDILGKPLLEALPELRGQGFDGLLDGVLASGVPYVGREVAVTLRRAPNDSSEEVIVNFVYVPIVEPDGSRSGVIVHANDVTAQVRARREIELAREQADAARVEAEKANRAKSDFLAAMSHELRTPLNAIAGYVDLLRMGIHGTVTEAQQAALERIERSERHLLSLINDILNFAKVEAGRVEYDLADVPLSDVVADIAPFVQVQLANKQLTYDANVDTDVVVRADREKVRQILLNLLSNAIKFTNSGGRIAVEVVARATGDQPKDVAFLRVTDSGIGIPAEKETTIFDPFVQVHRNLTRSMEGTGLGLAISRDLARGMGGDLRVRSVEGKGSSFTLTLPLSRSA